MQCQGVPVTPLWGWHTRSWIVFDVLGAVGDAPDDASTSPSSALAAGQMLSRPQQYWRVLLVNAPWPSGCEQADLKNHVVHSFCLSRAGRRVRGDAGRRHGGGRRRAGRADAGQRGWGQRAEPLRAPGRAAGAGGAGGRAPRGHRLQGALPGARCPPLPSPSSPLWFCTFLDHQSARPRRVTAVCLPGFAGRQPETSHDCPCSFVADALQALAANENAPP